VAERVLLHVGVPKSGTTYLQTSMWAHSEELRARGVLLPGERHADHRWGSYSVREDPSLWSRRRHSWGAWDRLLADVRSWPGTAVISHEFYGSATAEQAAEAMGAFAPARVEVVVTARDAVSLLTASWQETLKYRHQDPLDDFNHGVSDDPTDVWGWRNLDPSEVLGRWAAALPADRVHVVVVPRKHSDEPVLWRRFAGLFIDDPDALDVSTSQRNESLGVVESELLMRVNRRLDDLGLLARMNWIRDYLAEEKLVPRRGERFLPGPVRIEECRERSAQMVRRISEAGWHVVGDLDDLLVPSPLSGRRTPRDVTDPELVDAATQLVADVLLDLRQEHVRLRKAQRARDRLRVRVAELEAAAAATPPQAAWRRLVPEPIARAVRARRRA
jgi:hypothetical protein